MNPVTQAITADELFQMPADGFRYELVRGALKKMTPAGFKHGQLVVNLTVPLGAFVKQNRLGVVLGAETGFRLASNPDTVLAPDIAFISRERLEVAGETEKFWSGAPDLAVEVLSPTDTVSDVEEKVAAWLSFGARMVWVINPKMPSIHVHRSGASIETLAQSDVLDGQEVIPGFRLSVAEFCSTGSSTHLIPARPRIEKKNH
jgi:Uma2 family endonuclease